MTEVGTLAALPDHYQIIGREVQADNRYSGAPDSNLVYRQRIEAYRRQVAEKYGLHIYDATPAIERLYAEDHDGKLSYEVYLSEAQRFLSHMGVDIRLATPNDQLSFHGRPLAQSELQNRRFKQTILNMLYGYSDVPAEYIELAGQKHIILAAGMMDHGDEVLGYAVVDNAHDTAVFDASVVLGAHTFGHELGHEVDAALCGPNGMDKDHEFAAINGGKTDLYTGTTFDKKVPNYTDDVEIHFQAVNSATQDIGAAKIAEGCSVLGKQEATDQGVVAYSEYHPDMTEEKAELYGQLWALDGYDSVLDPHYPILESQALYLLARLHAYNPGLASYFLEVSNRPIALEADAICDALPTAYTP